jgi:hypothetical protein
MHWFLLPLQLGVIIIHARPYQAGDYEHKQEYGEIAIHRITGSKGLGIVKFCAGNIKGF